MCRTLLLVAIVLMGLLSFLFGGKAHASPSAPKVSPLTVELSRELQEKSQIGRELLAKYIGKERVVDAQAVDDAISGWSRDPNQQKASPSEVVDALGAVFGDYLAKKLNLEWMIFEDQHGKDLCVIHRKFFIYSFPHSAVYKAVVEGRANALTNVEEAIDAQVKGALGDPNVQTREGAL